jgi:DNA primase
MDISEQVLFNTLAQIFQKDKKDAAKREVIPQEAFEVIPTEKKIEKVDVQFQLEQKIIELLLLYGNVEEDFEELILEADEKGEITLKPEIHKSRVFEKIYLDLQEDEIEFMNPEFKELYFEVVNRFNQNPEAKAETFINELSPEMASSVTHILMEEERYSLSNWERMEIYVKVKEQTIAQMVSETILNLRRHLVSQKINELSEAMKQEENLEKESGLQEIVDYISLKKVLSNKLNRVL